MQNKVREFYDSFWSHFQDQPDLPYERDSIFPQVFQRGEKVLDLACGNGRSSLLISMITQTPVHGIDISPKAVKEARRLGIIAHQGDVEKKLPFKNKEFDVVFWGDNIEHLFSPELVIVEIRRVLKRNGKLIISTPNIGYWRYRLYLLLSGRLPDTEYTHQPCWEWGHIRFFNLQTLTDFLVHNGFAVERYWGINRRKVDNLFVKLFPQWFGMILVIKAVKN